MPADAPSSPAATEVLDFWFGAPGSPEHNTQRALWFRKSEATDLAIAQQFGALIGQALDGALADWADRPPSALARILLLDQFTRNTFRGTPRAFAGDALALAAARAMVAARHDEALPLLQRAFVYLPFEHAEDLPMQDESLRLFERLAGVAPEAETLLDYARRHRAVIARFGRFPHRNAILGRRSTDEENRFLLEPGSSF